MSDIRTQLRDHMQAFLQSKGDSAPFADSEPLFTNGRLNSLDAMETVIYLEENFGISFAQSGFDQTYIDSIEAMAKLVEAQKTN